MNSTRSAQKKLLNLKRTQTNFIDELNTNFNTLENNTLAKHKRLEAIKKRKNEEYISEYKDDLKLRHEQLKSFKNSKYDLLYFSVEIKHANSLEDIECIFKKEFEYIKELASLCDLIIKEDLIQSYEQKIEKIFSTEEKETFIVRMFKFFGFNQNNGSDSEDDSIKPKRIILY